MKYQILGNVSVTFSEVLEHEPKAIPCGSHVGHFSGNIIANNEQEAHQQIQEMVKEWKNKFNLQTPTMKSTTEENLPLPAPTVEDRLQPSS